MVDIQWRCVKTLGGTVTPVSAVLIRSQTPTRLNSINPQRSLAIFAPMLAPFPRLVLQRNDCVMAAYEGGGPRTGAVTLPAEAPGAPSARAGEANSKCGPSNESC